MTKGLKIKVRKFLGLILTFVEDTGEGEKLLGGFLPPPPLPPILNRVNAWVPQGSILGPTGLLIHINDLPHDVICNIAVYIENTTFHFKFDQASDLSQLLKMGTEHESDLWDTVDWGRKWIFHLNAGKTQLVSFDC